MLKFTEEVKYFFVSDLHIGHDNIVKLFVPPRPFSTIEEHDETIINNWRNTVGEKDKVFLLGDVFWKTHPRKIREICSSLPGEIYFIRGNHDRSRAVKIMEEYFIPLENCETIRIHNKYIVLSHFPIESWNGKDRGYLHIHGHDHNRFRIRKNKFCVSLENIDYKPIELNDVLKRIEKIKFWDLVFNFFKKKR